jgi:methyl-accepting chemotaxis protein
MSFIGPRPERKYYIDQIMERDPRYVRLYQIRPGVTSYATLYNGYTDTIDKMLRRLELDLYYLEHRSWWLDIKILTKDIHEIDQMLHDLANENNRIVEAITQLSATSEEVSASSTQAESVSNENLENADSARNHLNQVIEVSTKLDKYTM